METKAFILPTYFDYSATFLWAISGAILGAKKGYSLPGILTIVFISSVGGGLLRDGLFIQNGPPLVLRTPTYLVIIAIATAFVIVLGRYFQLLSHFRYLLAIVDAIGLGAYAVVGMNLAIAAGVSWPGVILVGMVNAVGGGILRDVLMGREPSMFQTGTLEEVLALLGCIFFVGLVRAFAVSQYYAAWLTIAVVFTLRVIAVRYHIHSKPLKGFKKN